jgi:hypothetical protein
MVMERQPSDGLHALLEFVTHAFRDFCRQTSLTEFSAAIDKHGSWAWSGGVTNGLNRSVSLYLTELAGPATGASGSYRAETWVEADDSHRFTRRQTSDWFLSPADGVQRKRMRADIGDRLIAAWQTASRLSEHDLSEDFIIPRTPT